VTTRAHQDVDELTAEASGHFRRMVESVGVKRFSSCMSLSTRQINRMLSGAQPNPVERVVRSLQSCHPDVGDEALGFICQEAGGQFVKDESPELDASAAEAVRECAEAIAAIADGEVSRVDEREVREAVSALTALLQAVKSSREAGGARARVEVEPKTLAGARQDDEHAGAVVSGPGNSTRSAAAAS